MYEISLSVISPLYELELLCLHTGIAIVSVQVNSFNHCFLTLIILFNINHLFGHSEVLTSIASPHYSIQHYSFVFIQLNGSKYCYVPLTIQLNISHLFTHS